jgi:stage V sporulation protein SpoVS
VARRQKEAHLGTYRPPRPVSPIPLKDIVDEGVFIAAGAVRMAVKNQAIIRTLRDRDDFEQGWFARAVILELEALALERHEESHRIAQEIPRAAVRSGKAEFQDDYRAGDVAKLRLRKKVLSALASRLRELATEPDYVAGLASTARENAWEEIQDAISATALRLAERSEPISDLERETRMSEVRFDLERWARR